MRYRSALAWTLGALTAGMGCAHNTNTTFKPTNETNVTAHKAGEEKRQPLPSTCVAFGTFSEQAAADPRRTPVDQEQLRDKARKAYQQALKLDPKDLAALTALARLYHSMDDHEHAILTYRRAVDCHPEQASLWCEFGMCHARHKEWEPALQYLKQAVQLDPEQRQYTHLLGFCLARAGKYDDSLAAFARIEGQASAHYNLAQMLYQMHEDELSKQHLRIALQMKPELLPAKQLLASVEGSANAGAADAMPASVDNTH